MTSCNPNWTPAATQAASGLDAKGEPWDQKDWNRTSVVGMLLCSSNNTSPDITCDAGQVARHDAEPAVPHRSV